MKEKGEKAMARYIDADALLKYIDERAKIYGITTSNKLNFMAFVEKAPTVHLSPCDVCAYNPPSSRDGKPCSMCQAIRKEED